MNLSESIGTPGNPPVSTDVKRRRVKRDLVVRRTTKHSKKLPKGVCKNQHLGVY